MKTFVYVANADSHDIAAFALDSASGDLHEVDRFAVGGTVMPLAVSPDGRFLHASIRSEPCRVLSFAIDPASGRLGEIGSAPLPASMCWISTDRSGRFLLSASYGGSLVAVSPIGPDGAAGKSQQVVPTEANAHSIRVDRTNRHAYAACLGGGVVRHWRFDADSGRLDDGGVEPWAARAGAGPRHFDFHPGAPFVYLLNELDASIDVLAVDPIGGQWQARQTVSFWPAGATGAPWAADIHMSPDGRTLYASERRSGTLAAFQVSAAGDKLTILETLRTESEPRGFALTPDGRFLLVAGQASHRLSRYAIAASTGVPEWLGSTAMGQNPNWVEVVTLPD